MKRASLFAIIFTVIIAVFSFIPNVYARDFDASDYAVYVPDSADDDKELPVIIGFSAGGSGNSVVNIWKDAAEKYKCIIIASNIVRNGIDIQNELKQIKQDLQNELKTKYPIDLKRVIAVGSSGGGMASHLFSFLHRDLIAGVISNVGYIHEGTIAQSNNYTRNKVCAFLAGSGDFNKPLMKEDLKFLQNHDWKCKWIEFEGGHHMAPEEYREEALEFVLTEINKQLEENHNG